MTHEPSEAMAQARIAGLDQQLRRGMVELVGAHGLDDAEIVDLLFQVRQPVGDPGAALSRLVKGKLRAQQFGHAADEGKALSLQKRSRTILAMKLLQFGLVVEQFQLAGRAAHVQIDNPLGAAAELRRQHGERVCRVAA